MKISKRFYPKRQRHHFVGSLQVIPMTARLSNTLNRAGVKSLDDIMNTRLKDFRRITNFGAKTMLELLELLNTQNLKHPEDKVLRNWIHKPGSKSLHEETHQSH